MKPKKKKVICNDCECETVVQYEDGSPEYCALCGSEDVLVVKLEERLLNSFEALDDCDDF